MAALADALDLKFAVSDHVGNRDNRAWRTKEGRV